MKSAEQNTATPLSKDANLSDVIRKWKQTCIAISECVSALGGDPFRIERLPDLHKHVRILEQLHDPVVEFLDANRPENLIEIVVDAVTTLAGEYGAPWLVALADQIQAQ